VETEWWIEAETMGFGLIAWRIPWMEQAKDTESRTRL